MATARNFNSISPDTVTLAADITTVGATTCTTSIAMSVGNGFPATPWRARIENEIIEVTAATTTTATITRGVASTTAATHTTGARIIHSVTGEDFQDLNDHVLAVHPRGRVAGAQITANFTAVSAATEVMVTGMAATFTFITGRRYRVWVVVNARNVGATLGTVVINVRWAAGASVTTAGTQLQSMVASVPATANWTVPFGFFVDLTCVASGATGNQINAGSDTVGVSMNSPSANSLALAATTIPAQIEIDDMGV